MLVEGGQASGHQRWHLGIIGHHFDAPEGLTFWLVKIYSSQESTRHDPSMLSTGCNGCKERCVQLVQTRISETDYCTLRRQMLSSCWSPENWQATQACCTEFLLSANLSSHSISIICSYALLRGYISQTIIKTILRASARQHDGVQMSLS